MNQLVFAGWLVLILPIEARLGILGTENDGLCWLFFTFPPRWQRHFSQLRQSKLASSPLASPDPHHGCLSRLLDSREETDARNQSTLQCHACLLRHFLLGFYCLASEFRRRATWSAIFVINGWPFKAQFYKELLDRFSEGDKGERGRMMVF